MSCTDGDLSKTKSIKTAKSKIPVDKTYEAQIIYSDSAKVKAKGFAPILEKYQPADGKNYEVMPKGVKVEFYDENTKVKTILTADSAIRKAFEHITIMKGHVVVKNMEGSTFNSDELIWDEQKQKFYSDKLVKVTNATGNVLYATGFSAPQDFKSYTFVRSTGEANVNDNPLFQTP